MILERRLWNKYLWNLYDIGSIKVTIYSTILILLKAVLIVI